MSGRSIAARLRRDIVGALLLSSLVTFAGLYLIGRAQRLHAFEQALQDDLRAISNITQTFPDDDVYVNIQPDALTEFQAGGTRFFQLWDAKSRVLLDTSPSLDALKFKFDRPLPITAEPRRLEARLPDGREASLIVVQFLSTWGLEEDVLRRLGQTVNDHEVQLLVGRTRQELDASLWPLALACAAGALFLPLLAASVLALRVPHAMRPLSDVVREIEQRSPDDVRPFAASDVREVQPFVSRLNQLMERIAGARHRERQFLAHAAHELRTPLAELYATADVALLMPDDPNGHAEALEDMRAVTRRAARLVDALFRLARHGRSGPKVRHPVRLEAFIAEAVAQAAQASRQRELEWQLEGAGDACVMSDPLLLRALLDNLIGNAIAHARAGTTVLVRWHGDDPTDVELRNRCDPKSAPHGPEGEHLGHGLTVAQLYAFALDATLQTLREEEQFTARIRISFASASPR